MLASVNTVAFTGIEARPVSVQVHIAQGGLPCFSIVGLVNRSVSESRDRIRAAFTSIGLGIPAKRITANLSPADLIKEGSHFDLSIAIGLLVAMQIVPCEEVENYIIMGELALDGSFTRVNGILPAAIRANSIGMGIICPRDNANEAVWSGNPDIVAPSNLVELVNHFTGKQLLQKLTDKDHIKSQFSYYDMRDVRGQNVAKRAMEIAAAGRHHILMIGEPGSGKSMMAKRMPSILPQLTTREILEVSIVASVAGILTTSNPIMTQIPFRDPHCSSSVPAMAGGGRDARPGEMTLAHFGVLFLDELPEFQRAVLESLRQPMESGFITIARVNAHITYPARFQLIAAMNPCKCGYYGSMRHPSCSKAPKCAEEYQNRVSGPLLDRFDLQIYMASNEIDAIQNRLSKCDIMRKIGDANDANCSSDNEGSVQILDRVVIARNIQKRRCELMDIVDMYNADLDGDLLYEVTRPNDEAQKLLISAANKLTMSMRSMNRVLRVARTVADLEYAKKLIVNGRTVHELCDEQCTIGVTQYHVAEALTFRISRGGSLV